MNGKNVIWPMLLEKAFAKINKSYDNIEWGTNFEGMNVLTGATSITYRSNANNF
jgi:hypothetical protein